MDVRHLVLELGESESATEVQARLDKAAGDGFFLVSVAGRFAFLRTTVTHQKASKNPSSPGHGGNISNRDGQDDAARAIIKANSTWTVKPLVKLLAESGIKRGKSWVTEARLETRGGSKITSA